MVELTIEQAKDYLASVGITLPDMLLGLLVSKVNAMDPCLIGAGYDDETALLIKYYTLAVFGVVSGDRLVTSQRAPSGAAQTYAYGTLSDNYNKATALLRAFDPSGCSDAIIPMDPTAASAGIWVAVASCGCDE